MIKEFIEKYKYRIIFILLIWCFVLTFFAIFVLIKHSNNYENLSNNLRSVEYDVDKLDNSIDDLDYKINRMEDSINDNEYRISDIENRIYWYGR